MTRGGNRTDPTMPLVVVTVGGHPPGPNERLHWATRHAVMRARRDQVAWQCKEQYSGQPLVRARLEVIFTYGRRPFRDLDNCIASVKGDIDGLVIGGVLTDDSPAHLDWLPVQQLVGARRGVILKVFDADAVEMQHERTRRRSDEGEEGSWP